MNGRQILALLTFTALAGCGADEFQDLKDFVKQSGDSLRGRIEPLPELKQFEAFTYNAFDIPDPFKPRKLESERFEGGPQPDLNRRREALEGYPLEGLKMVGTLEQKKTRYALVRTPDLNLYRVKTGNYVGQNFGVITSVTDASITLKEVVQDPASGQWTERTNTLQLLDEEEHKK
jgi:type IV pilus assembly protein PilP